MTQDRHRVSETRNKAVYVPLPAYNNCMYTANQFATRHVELGSPYFYPIAPTSIHGAPGYGYGHGVRVDGSGNHLRSIRHIATEKMDGQRTERNNDGAFVFAFNQLVHGIESLGIFSDFWGFTCWGCDRWRRPKADEDYKKKKGLLKALQAKATLSAADFKKINELELELREKDTPCSKYISPEEGDKSFYFRMFLQTIIVSVYFILFVLLAVYHQDAVFCQKFSDSYLLKPGCKNIMESDKCQFRWAASTLKIQEYSMIRVIFFVAACVPYLFLYFCSYMQEKKLLNQYTSTSPPSKDKQTNGIFSIFLKEKSNSYQINTEDATSYGLESGDYEETKAAACDCGSFGFIRNVFFGLFVACFGLLGIMSLSLDIEAFNGLKDCNMKPPLLVPNSTTPAIFPDKDWKANNWSLYLGSTPYDLPIGLFVTNLIATVWGLWYMGSRFCYLMSKSKNKTANWQKKPKADTLSNDAEAQPPNAAQPAT